MIANGLDMVRLTFINTSL